MKSYWPSLITQFSSQLWRFESGFLPPCTISRLPCKPSGALAGQDGSVALCPISPQWWHHFIAAGLITPLFKLLQKYWGQGTPWICNWEDIKMPDTYMEGCCLPKHLSRTTENPVLMLVILIFQTHVFVFYVYFPVLYPGRHNWDKWTALWDLRRRREQASDGRHWPRAVLGTQVFTTPFTHQMGLPDVQLKLCHKETWVALRHDGFT